MIIKLPDPKAPPSIMTSIGHINDVIASKPRRKAPKQWIDADSFDYAFECGSPQSYESMGEMIAFNKQAYTTSTDASSDDYLKLLHGESLVTAGLFIVPTIAEPAFDITWEATGEVTLDELYQDLYSQIKRPFTVVGTATFSAGHVTMLTKPPIHGENLLDNVAEYFIDPPAEKKPLHAAIMGAAGNFGDTENFPELMEQMRVVLYSREQEALTGFVSHTHALELKKEVNNIDDVTPEMGVAVHHLFPHSPIEKCHLKIYPIDQVIPLTFML